MAEIRVKDNESLDSALRRFKRQCARAGVLNEVRKREHYEKPSVKRKKKSEAASKRKFKSCGGKRAFARFFFIKARMKHGFVFPDISGGESL